MPHDLHWTEAEKKQARRSYEAARLRELDETVADFQRRAAAVKDIDEVWAIEAYLRQRRHELDAKYDFRYSQLPLVFGILLREGRITEQDLDKLHPDKLVYIRNVASL